MLSPRKNLMDVLVRRPTVAAMDSNPYPQVPRLLKTLSAATLAAVAAAGPVSAGETAVDTSKTSTYQPTVEQCFRDREWQVDLFGAYTFTQTDQERLIGDHAWGGGIGVNYFFQRNIGLGVEGTLLDPRGDKDVIGQAALNVFIRFPIDASCIAPYFYVGGGAVFNAEGIDREDLPGGDDDDGNDSDALLEGHAGLGIEYRFRPNVGIFVDGRFTVVDQTENNFATVRTGVRIAF
jgi:hypothetical protein